MAKISHRPQQCRRVGDLPVGGGVDIDRAEKVLLPQAVLRDLENFRARQYRPDGGDQPYRLGRDVFELERHDVDGQSKALECPAIGEFGNRRRAAHLLGRAVGLGRKDVAAIAEPGGGERRHPAELPAP